MSEIIIKDAAGECIIDIAYGIIQMVMKNTIETYDFRYITSRSTEDNVEGIERVCQGIQRICKEYFIPIDGIFLRKTDMSIKMYKCLLCNTSFNCQLLLNEDTELGYIVDTHPSFSSYVFIEIVWYLNYESILTESILHFPLDLCIEILEIVPRCIESIASERAFKFLNMLVLNAYKKFQIIKDSGTQSEDIIRNAKKFAGNLQQLILQLSNERYFLLEKGSKIEQHNQYGKILKKIIQLVRACLTSKFKKIQLPNEFQKKYKLTFGNQPVEQIDDSTLKACLKEVDYELISLLLKKVKEVDCNMYMNWTEYDDDINTSLTLQKAIGLEVYFFIENTEEFKKQNTQEYNHLIECLQQISTKPDPENSLESLNLNDLCSGVLEGRKNCLVNLIHRYKEWDDTIIDIIDSNISLLNKTDYLDIFEYIANELNRSLDEIDLNNLQICLSSLAKAILHLKIIDVYELTTQSILKFGENEKLENVVDVSSFEKFLMHNSSISNMQNLSIVLFFLCFNTREALKILLKMTIGHLDYPDVAVSLDDLMLLLPIFTIRVYRKQGDMVEALKIKCTEKIDSKILDEHVWKLVIKADKNFKNDFKTTNLMLSVLQEIYVEGSGWNINKMSNLIQYLYTFCSVSEVVEVFVPFLLLDKYQLDYLKYTLLELLKVTNDYKSNDYKDYNLALTKPAMYLLSNNHVSRYLSDELLTMIFQLFKNEFEQTYFIEASNSNKQIYNILLFASISSFDLFSIINLYIAFHQRKIIIPTALATEDILRHFFLKCTRLQFLKSVDGLINGQSCKILKVMGNIHICDKIIQLTFENCLICLEYPHVAPPDSLSFLIRNLMILLPTVELNKKRVKQLGKILDTHVAILQSSIKHTAISGAFEKLQKHCQDSNYHFTSYLDAYEEFAFTCTKESEKLQTFGGLHSPLGIKLLLAYDVINKSIDEGVTEEEMVRNLAEYFKEMKV